MVAGADQLGSTGMQDLSPIFPEFPQIVSQNLPSNTGFVHEIYPAYRIFDEFVLKFFLDFPATYRIFSHICSPDFVYEFVYKIFPEVFPEFFP